ncbi:Uncharacterised protein [Bordetella pertussis]|nr:Uncharacterised protein [Bordetella pertussis]
METKALLLLPTWQERPVRWSSTLSLFPHAVNPFWKTSSGGRES